MTLGEYVKKWRETHNLSQREFARRADLSNSAISTLERGINTLGEPYEPNFITVRKVARAMGMSADALIMSVDDFNIDISDQLEETPIVKQFIENAQMQSPDEMLLLQTYRLIPEAHRSELLQAALQIKMKYEDYEY